MSPGELLLLFSAGVIAGGVNAVAGGGTFFTFSALLAVGLPPIPANATSAVSVVPGYLGSAFAYRREIRSHPGRFAFLGVLSLLGGALGALLLLALDNTHFRILVPWLLLGATLLFLTAPRIVRRARSLGRAAHGHPPAGYRRLAAGIQFLTSVYGGFFGAGMGIVLLATLAVSEVDDFHLINAAKNLLSVLIQGAAVGLFIVAGIVHWPQAAVITLASLLGGYLGIVVAKRIEERWIRRFVIGVGTLLSLYFFLAD